MATLNVRRGLKKDGGRKQSGLSWLRRVVICLFLVCAGQEKMFQFQSDNYIKFYIFGTIVTLLTLDSVVSWSLMMR